MFLMQQNDGHFGVFIRTAIALQKFPMMAVENFVCKNDQY